MIDYDVRPGPSDLVLVVEADGVPRVVRRWRVPPAAWVVGVVRMLDPTVVRL